MRTTPGTRPDPARAPVDRATASDLVMRAVDARSPVPQHVGAVLLLDSRGTTPAELGRVLGRRAAAVPRLRQRLVALPPGFGRPVWVEVPDFDAAVHVRELRCPSPGDEQALLDLAVRVVGQRLPRRRPLWAAVLVPGLADGRTALVLVVHHVLADGLGGLALLSRILDPAPADDGAGAEPARVPAVRPSWRRLAADALASDLAGLRRVPTACRELGRAVRAGGGLRSEAAVACSLLGRTRGQGRVAVARADLAALRATAHRYGGTVNDAVLCAVGGALHALLRTRGETVPTFRVAVMVSARRVAGPAELGNRVAPLLVGVPGEGSPEERLRAIAGRVGRARAQATVPPVVSTLGPVFRVAARLGLYRLYMRRQRRLHTLVSDVRGPARPGSLAGAPVTAVLPITLGEAGNVTLSFVALSYAGTLTVSVVADAVVDDLPVLAVALQEQLDSLLGAPAARPA